MAAVDLTSPGAGPSYSINGPNIALINVNLTAAQAAATNEYLIARFSDNVSLRRNVDGSILITYPALGAAAAITVGIGDADGTIDTELIATSTTPIAGGVDTGPAAGAGLLDVSGKYLIFNVTVAGDAAGTISVELSTVGKPTPLLVNH